MQNPPRLRVTPEELTQALAAIEAQRQDARRREEEEARYVSRTISVDEAVRELSLDVTPGEIEAKILSQRQALKQRGVSTQTSLREAAPRSVTWASPTAHLTEAPDFDQERRERNIGPVLVGILLLKLLLIWSIVSLYHRW